MAFTSPASNLVAATPTARRRVRAGPEAGCDPAGVGELRRSARRRPQLLPCGSRRTAGTWRSTRRRRTWCRATPTARRRVRAGPQAGRDPAGVGEFDGLQGNAGSGPREGVRPGVSADGRFVAFASEASNLVAATPTAGRRVRAGSDGDVWGHACAPPPQVGRSTAASHFRSAPGLAREVARAHSTYFTRRGLKVSCPAVGRPAAPCEQERRGACRAVGPEGRLPGHSARISSSTPAGELLKPTVKWCAEIGVQTLKTFQPRPL